MKKYKIHLLSLLFLVICISCKKNECSRCYYTVKGVNPENGEVLKTLNAVHHVSEESWPIHGLAWDGSNLVRSTYFPLQLPPFHQ